MLKYKGEIKMAEWKITKYFCCRDKWYTHGDSKIGVLFNVFQDVYNCITKQQYYSNNYYLYKNNNKYSKIRYTISTKYDKMNRDFHILVKDETNHNKIIHETIIIEETLEEVKKSKYDITNLEWKLFDAAEESYYISSSSPEYINTHQKTFI